MFTIHPQTHMGRVHLTVADLGRSLDYYQQRIGLTLIRQEDRAVYLGAGERELLVLTEQPGARPMRHTTGLYHFALLTPSRLELARTLQHLIQTETPIYGASDHAVSEALYLTDPDGHGIEIYRDRPRAQWEFPNGRLKMVTEPFDADGVLGELNGRSQPYNGIHPDTIMGHVHLHVANIPDAELFYGQLLGFEIMARYGPSASFAAAGGYHHHLGLNTWAGVGAPPPPPDAARLLWYEIVLPDTAVLDELTRRIEAVGLAMEKRGNGRYLTDPAGNGILLITTQPRAS
ncbi:MAG: VOC family protein [Ardenticatenaceae bacterium]|nr:VOC family protein [Ardenticatenaceae bacterium]